MIPLFIGYEPREALAYHVCVNSIIRNSTQPLSITPLSLNNLTHYKELHSDSSNSFTYTRFLVPELMGYKGWAIFIDGDMILRDDITKLWNMCENSTAAVMVVKHDYKTKMPTKYLGAKNENYPCKNWSSVILWNCNHPKNKILTTEFVQSSSGSYLHRFSWLTENDIEELPIEWNWLPDEFGENANAKLLHYTLGIPEFAEFANGSMTSDWHLEKIHTLQCGDIG